MTNPNTQINGRLEKKKNYDQRNGGKKIAISCVALQKVSKRIFNKFKSNDEQKCRVVVGVSFQTFRA